jgi:hypothetical protein
MGFPEIKITQHDFEKRKQENAVDKVRIAVNDLMLNPAYKTDLASLLRINKESLVKRLAYTDILSSDRMIIVREIRILNETIEQIELTHEDRRDKKRSTRND